MDIVKKTGLERIVKRHHASTDKIQPIVDELVKEGLTIGTDELRDLSDKCALLYREAENMAKNPSVSRSHSREIRIMRKRSGL